MKLGFLGVGNMASAIINSLFNSNFSKNKIYLFDLNENKMNYFKMQGTIITKNAIELFENADIIFLAVKPQTFEEAVKDISLKTAADKLIVSIMAGVTIEKISLKLGKNTKIIRTMPNTPLMSGLGATGIARKNNVNDDEFNFVKNIFDKSGISTEVSEVKLDTITALSGSGPAYVYLFAKYMSEYAIENGIDEKVAVDFAIQTFSGAASMMKNSDFTIDELIKNVSSPNGTTVEALKVFYEMNLKETVFKAMESCKNRSKELSKS